MNPPPRTPTAGGDDGGAGERIFTAYVRSLEPGHEPGAEDFDRVWGVLRGALLREMQRRSVASAPPSYVGVYGWSDWRDPGALDDLTGTCYAYVFVTRLRSLRAQLRVKDNVDGLVFRNLRNFLHDRQKEHDPVGYRAYRVLRRAVRRGVETGRLEVLEGGPGIGNDTLLGLAGRGAEPPPDDSAELARRRRALEALVAQWNAELLPDLITARGRKRDAVADELAERLPEMGDEDVTAFRFRELLRYLRNDLRRRWAAVLWQTRGGMAPRDSVEPATGAADDEDLDSGFVRVLRLYRPDPPPEQQVAARRDFRSLTDCVSSQVEGYEADRRTRGYLETFWQFLRTSVVHSEPIPSNRKMAELLGIPRERFGDLYETVAGLVKRCRELLRGRAGSRAGGRGRRNDGQGGQTT